MSGWQWNAARGESFDSVALEVYGNEKYAAALIDANPDLSGTIVFDGGEAVLLPLIDLPERGEEARLYNTTAPWK